MPRKTTPNVSVAAAEFVRHRFAKSESQGVRYGYVSLLRRFANHTGNLQVGSLRPRHIEDFFYGDGGLSDTAGRTTLGKYRGELKQFLAFCHRREWNTMSADMLMGGITHKTTHANRNRYRMTRAELIRLLDAAEDPRDRALIAFVANTGCRISEALAMKVRDVSFQKNELYVTAIKTKEEITLPLSSDLADELRGWLTVYTDTMRGMEKGWYLFPTYHVHRFVKKDGRRSPLERNYNPVKPITHQRKIIQTWAEKAGIELEPGDGWHTVRRSFARILFDDAVDMGHDGALRITQAALNHKFVQTTEAYLGLDIEKERYAHMIRGKRFLTLGQDTDTVVPLRKAQ
jgi:integrase